MSKKIILLLFPPLINKFNFPIQEKVHFFDLVKDKKKHLENSNPGLPHLNELFNLINKNYDLELKKTIQKEKVDKLILINYPRTEAQFTSLNQTLVKEKQNISSILLVNITNYELISILQQEYLICPLCEKIYTKSEVVKENDTFICPLDNQYQLPLGEVIKFNENIMNYYLTNTKKLIEKFLEKNQSSSVEIIQITAQNQNEIEQGELQKKILKVISEIK